MTITKIIIINLLVSFTLTLIIEYIIVKLMLTKKKVFVPVLLVNMLTNPLVVYIYNIMSIYSFKYKEVILLFLEILVVIVEGYVYRFLLDLKLEKALIVSFIANAVAYIFGIIINFIL